MCKYVFRELQEFDLIKPRNTCRDVVGDVGKVSGGGPRGRPSWTGVAQGQCFAEITPSQVEDRLKTN